ncbi:virulence factor [Candidatus Poriferisocius sp.]|uniref:virulence factor n=1 Tax=Candidatus Poriferisocius sp. TaxID=3101276 RepID=UPI003B02AB61
MSRRRGGNGNLVVICWRDIPAQVNAGSGSSKTQRILPRRFQRAIDRAAMVAGKTQASDYVGEWRWKLIPGDPADPEGAALRAAEELEAAFPLKRLDAFVATGGWDPSAGEPAAERLEPSGPAGADEHSPTISPQEAAT